MRKRWIAMFLTVALSAAANAQDVATLFVKMPDEHVAELEAAARQDLVDLYKAGKEAKVTNAMQGETRLLQLTPDYLALETSPQSRMEIRRLPLVNRTYVICVVTTVKGPAEDSRVEFFTTEWVPLPASELYRAATAGEFVRPEADTTAADYGDVRAAADMDLFVYRLDAERPTLTAVYNTPQYFDRATREKAGRYFRQEPKVYTWKNGRFEEN